MQGLLIWCCCLLLSAAGYVCLVQGQEANPMRAPSRPQRAERPVGQAGTASLPTRVFDTYLRFFQQVISPVDGARSTMYPTGSAYARQALNKHGALLGSVLTIERLMHEGNEEQVAPRVKKYGLWRVYDPVEANDWWWHNPDWVYTPVVSFPHR